MVAVSRLKLESKYLADLLVVTGTYHDYLAPGGKYSEVQPLSTENIRQNVFEVQKTGDFTKSTKFGRIVQSGHTV